MHLDSLHVLAEASLAQQTPSPKPNASAIQSKAPIMVQRRKTRQHLNKGSEVPIAKTVQDTDPVIQLVSADGGESMEVDSDVGVTAVDHSEGVSTVFVAGQEFVVTADDGVQTSADIPADSSQAIPTADDTIESANQGVQDSATDPLHHVSAGQPTTKVSTDAASTVTPITIPANKVPSIVSTNQSGVSADKATDPASTCIDKGKSVMLEPALPSRKKSKKELELERLSEQVSADLVAADLANEAKRQEELRQSEILARKLQEDLDKLARLNMASSAPQTEGPSQAPKRKSADVGWEYGYLADPDHVDKVKCNLCGKIVSGGVNRLKQHIAGIPGQVTACPKSTTEQQMKCRNALNEVKIKKKKKKKQQMKL
ncbi:zinc finger, BED-type [Artemisia annua]|uniref:Zinc finger, BED-type n=1 Tax=Artemisia annua TaxID=35608 RepID=A0A2U1LRA0_ARTAN|nr:zinc finger, BED-type [Artemisia annua]